MNILLVSRIDSPEALEFSGKVKDVLEKEGCDVAYDRDTAPALGIAGKPLAGTNADVVIVVGGDGTILRTVQQMNKPVPVLGINWGEVGFLADLEPAEALEFVRRLPSGFSIEERMRISLCRDGIFVGDALNEALIVTTRPAKMLRFSIIIDGVVSESFRADGLLVEYSHGLDCIRDERRRSYCRPPHRRVPAGAARTVSALVPPPPDQQPAEGRDTTRELETGEPCY